jgi:Short-chain alcohol dehydrogenase of unknown specificity
MDKFEQFVREIPKAKIGSIQDAAAYSFLYRVKISWSPQLTKIAKPIAKGIRIRLRFLIILARNSSRGKSASVEIEGKMTLPPRAMMTWYIVPGMVNRGRGHVVNIGSIAGRQTYPKGNVYCASKAAVRAISEGLKQDLLGTPVRVTEIEPGLVETEFSNVRFHGDAEKAKNVYQGLTPLTPDDVADVVYFCATRSPHVNISEVLLVPTDQAGATLVHRSEN